jgi:transcriptional repressor NrdR
MRCPFCGNDDSQVKDSRPTEDASAIRRRRQCPACGGRFTTFERVQLRELTIVKKSGKREVFDRDKLARSIEIACRKRPIEPERIERMVNGVVRRLESMGDAEIEVDTVGEMVMEGLQSLDPIAFIRFASVYRDFREPKDFETLIGSLTENLGRPAATPAPAGAAPPPRQPGLPLPDILPVESGAKH